MDTFDLKSIMPKEFWYCYPLFSKLFPFFLFIKTMLVTLFPLYHSVLFCFVFFKKFTFFYLFIYLFIYDCVESPFLREGFL